MAALKKVLCVARPRANTWTLYRVITILGAACVKHPISSHSASGYARAFAWKSAAKSARIWPSAWGYSMTWPQETVTCLRRCWNWGIPRTGWYAIVKVGRDARMGGCLCVYVYAHGSKVTRDGGDERALKWCMMQRQSIIAFLSRRLCYSKSYGYVSHTDAGLEV